VDFIISHKKREEILQKLQMDGLYIGVTAMTMVQTCMAGEYEGVQAYICELNAAPDLHRGKRGSCPGPRASGVPRAVGAYTIPI